MTRVLIVDDQQQNLYMLQVLLSARGFEVGLAANGAEALERARRAPPDLLISDILMPVMDGFSLCRAWKEDERLKGIPFVFYTATYTDSKDKDFALSLGADGFIVKPLEPDKFLALLQETIEAHAAGKLAARHEPIIEEACYNREYNAVLIRKLEDKVLQIEEANRALELDITDRKRTEEALRASQEKYRVLVENAAEAIFVAQDGMLKFANDRIEGVIGYSKEELLSKPFTEFIHPDDRALVLDRHVKRQRGEAAPSRYSFRIVNSSGETRWGELNVVPIEWEGKVASLNFLSDITERKQAEEMLRTSEERYRGLFEASPIALREEDFSAVKARIEELRSSGVTDFGAYFASHPGAVADCVARVKTLDVNQAAAELLGATDKQELLSGLSVVLPAGSCDSFVEELVAIAEGQTSFEGEVVNRTVSGKEIHAVCRWCAAPGYEETLAKVLVSLMDLTERKRLEERLLQSQKMEIVGRLAGGIAHDFNNLLTAILGYATFALEALPAGNLVRRDMEQVIKAADRAANLTRQLLAFSRRQIIEMQAISLNDLIMNMDKMLRRLIGEDIQLVTLPGGDLAPVRADPGQLEQVLMNLAVNARDAMPGVGTLTIETANVSLDEEYVRQHPGAEPGAYVMLAVTDTGTGMTGEVKSHLFEPYFTTKGVGKGTGLGLSTVYGIVKQHGGAIYVYSEVGQGSTFKVYLPAVEGEAEGLPPRDEVGYLPQGNETVLVVEDESTVRAFTVRTLAELGYTLLEASDGEEALRVAQEHPGPISLLLADVVMPQMGGKELAERMEAERPDMRVLFASGYTDDAIVHNGILDKGLAFLQKPYTTAALARKVREVLDLM